MGVQAYLKVGVSCYLGKIGYQKVKKSVRIEAKQTQRKQIILQFRLHGNGPKFKIWDPGSWVWGGGLCIPDLVPWILHPGSWIVDPGC